jgi:hypothetical protein
MLVALAGIVSCNGEDDSMRKDLEEARATIEDLNNRLSTKETEVDDLTDENLKLNEDVRELESAKEMGEVELDNLKWEENDREFKLILTGTVKNTGKAYLYDVTVKVGIMDETENVIVVPTVNDEDRESMPMLFFHNVADSMNTGDSKDFEMVIYTRKIRADGLGKVKESIRREQGPTTWEVTGLFNTAK